MKKTDIGKGKQVRPIHNQKIYTNCVFYKNMDSLLKVITKIGSYYEFKDVSIHSMEKEMESILSIQVMMEQAFKARSSVWQ